VLVDGRSHLRDVAAGKLAAIGVSAKAYSTAGFEDLASIGLILRAGCAESNSLQGVCGA